MTTVRERIEQLPELPVESFEVAGKLGYSDKVPVITIRPRKFPAPKKPSTPKKLGPNKSTYSITKYAVMVTYPKVVCQPPSVDPSVEQVNSKALFEQKDIGESYEPESNLEIISKKERFYKLTTLKGRKLGLPWWCSVKYGPWVALVTEVVSCTLNVPNHWTLYIGEIPEVTLSWYGLWSDIPPYPSLRLFPALPLTFFSETHGCCPGFNYCPPLEACIPLNVKCQDPFPL
jgi:hypothetical protein